MSELGRNGITLTAVSDACSVVFSPSSCVVHADFDGSNPVLTYAYTDINVVRGDVKLAITTSNITIPSRSNNNITYSLTAIDTYTVRLQITAIPTTILNGNLGVKVTLGAFEILSSFPFTVVRESSMLDWIQDWDGRRTSIGGASIVTPKIFAGSKDSDNSLTGVYLGPDTAGAGIYGYKAVPDPSNTGHTITSEVFHINSNGASIGGWNIETGGITTVDSVSGYSLQLLSSGSIIAKDDNDATIYALYRSGEASFAKGNVLFHADGSAKFVGEIQAGSGKIGNWLISENAIHKAHVVLDSNVSAIMILASDNYQNTANAYIAALKTDGGIKMYYTSSGDYGMEAWLPATEETVGDVVVTQYHQAFALGSSNFIAGWHFDDERLYGTYAMIVGTNGNAGLYVSSSDISGVAVSGLTTSIAAGTGIYITAHNNFHELAGYAGGNLVFRLGTNGNQIAGWNFTAGNIFCGSTTMSSDGFTGSSGSMLISTQTGIVGYKWMFKSDGSGKLAGGKISWAADGSGSIASGKIEWDASGNLTFLGGTVKSGSGNNPAWILSPDGSGSFASGNISWTTAGALSLTGTLSVSGGCVQLDNAGICSEGSSSSSIRFWAGAAHSSRATANFRVTQDGKLYASGATISGSITASEGAIGLYNINANGLYYGDITKWNDSTYHQNLAYITPGIVRLQRQHGVFTAGDVGNIKVGIGDNADPDDNGSYAVCSCAGYFYRQMNGYDNIYQAAVKIISDNVINRDVALYTKGAIACNGGLISNGRIINTSSVNVMDLSFGTTVVVQNSTENMAFYLPKPSTIRQIFGLSSSSPYVIPITIIAHKGVSKNFLVVAWNSAETTYSQDASTFINYNGGNHSHYYVEMGAGDILKLALIYDGTNRYVQILDSNY